MEVKNGTKSDINYLPINKMGTQCFHFFALKQQVLWEETFLGRV